MLAGVARACPRLIARGLRPWAIEDPGAADGVAEIASTRGRRGLVAAPCPCDDAAMTGLATLSSRIAVPHVRDRAVDACERLVSREVEAKRGLSGAAIRAGHAAVLRIKPTMVRDVLRALLPAFAEALEPFWHGDETEGAARVEGFVARLSARPEAAAEALLGVTDERIDLARPAVRRGYQVLRPSALAHVRAAVPGLADALREALSAQPGT